MKMLTILTGFDVTIIDEEAELWFLNFDLNLFVFYPNLIKLLNIDKDFSQYPKWISTQKSSIF